MVAVSLLGGEEEQESVTMDDHHIDDSAPRRVYNKEQLSVEVPETAHQISQGLSPSSPFHSIPFSVCFAKFSTSLCVCSCVYIITRIFIFICTSAYSYTTRGGHVSCSCVIILSILTRRI